MLGAMTISPPAGQPAPTPMLVNMSRLVSACYEERPGVAVAAEGVAFGTSGHRGSSCARTFNEAHIVRLLRRSATIARRTASPVRCSSALTRMRCRSQPQAVPSRYQPKSVDVTSDLDRGYQPTPVVSRAILRYNHGRTSGMANAIVLRSRRRVGTFRPLRQSRSYAPCWPHLRHRRT